MTIAPGKCAATDLLIRVGGRLFRAMGLADALAVKQSAADKNIAPEPFTTARLR
jgi:hypothetical protein